MVDTYSPSSYRSSDSLCDSKQLVQVQCYAKVPYAASKVAGCLCSTAMHTHPGVSIRKQRPARLIAKCDTFRVRKRIAVSDFLLTWSSCLVGLKEERK